MTRRTAKNPLFSGQKVVKRSSRESVGSAIPALDITPDVGGPVMPNQMGTIQWNDSTSNSPKCDTWKSLGALAAELARKAGGK